MGKGGCIAPTPVINNGAEIGCGPDAVWNGQRCLDTAAECAVYATRAALIVTELLNLRVDVQRACGQNPASQACIDLRQSQQNAQARYLGLWNEASIACRTRLPDPGSLL